MFCLVFGLLVNVQIAGIGSQELRESRELGIGSRERGAEGRGFGS